MAQITSSGHRHISDRDRVHSQMSAMISTKRKTDQTNLSVRRLLLLGLGTRLLLDTSTQIFFPFLTVIAAGLGVTPVVLGRLISLRSITGLASPFFGDLADRRGYRYVLRLALLILVTGMVVIGSSVNLWMAMLGMLLTGIGSFAFVPTFMAYLSAQLPYERRAQGVGILEYAWALSGIVGLSLVGLLIQATNWRLPFFIIALFLLGFWVLYQELPAVQHVRRTESAESRSMKVRLGQFLHLGPNASSTWANIGASGFLMFGAMHIFITYGHWLSSAYGLGPAALGRAALMLGTADLVGSVSVSLFSDRIGKRKAVLLGSLAAIVGYSILPFFDTGPIAVMIGLALARSLFEFTLVSNISLLSEQNPAQRGKVMSLSTATALLGSTAAGLSGPWAYARFGAWGLGWASAAAMLLVFLLVWRLVREPGTTAE